MRLNCGKSPRYRPLDMSRSLVAIIVDPSAPVYSFQARRPTDEDAAGTATPATTSMPRQRLRSILEESRFQGLGISQRFGHAALDQIGRGVHPGGTQVFDDRPSLHGQLCVQAR